MRRTGQLFRALLACLLAVAFLSGTGATAARWYDARTVAAGAQVHTGQLDLEQGPTTMTVTRPGPDGTTTSFPLGSKALVVGDTVTITTAATVHARGTTLAATLALDLTGLTTAPGSAALRTELTRGMTVTSDGAPLTPSDGQVSWPVTAADDGATRTVTITLPLRADRDGQAWGAELQGQTLTPGALRWTLTQD
ncbi:hypothetical protein MF406_03515 [Georgenia sp. TF02-10]|uniref:hypothetical protein n=1 Tax=Georgenia sp. TF02-10 TaxID=2917725 RepID=UPI001FA75456|nr:hypothetical protein [Georgenia sp. TF02-10]UNX55353.1 hypothetical protein MF406_03515 [Georgenia sp. TF02-10]